MRIAVIGAGGLGGYAGQLGAVYRPAPAGQCGPDHCLVAVRGSLGVAPLPISSASRYDIGSGIECDQVVPLVPGTAERA